MTEESRPDPQAKPRLKMGYIRSTASEPGDENYAVENRTRIERLERRMQGTRAYCGEYY